MQPEPFDSAELDAILELERSPGYGLVVARIAEEIERNRRELERDLPPDATAKVRGRIAALYLVLSIPGILKHEIRGALSA